MIEDWETIYELIKSHYEETGKIENYNLWEKIRTRLSSVYTLEERSEIKKKIKKILELNEAAILNRDRYKNIAGMPIKVNEWIRDFTSNLGVGKYENIKKANYLTRGTYITKLAAEDKEKVEKLLELYENASLPSTTREGFEDDVPVDLGNGRVGIFTRGNVEEIDPKLTEQIRAIVLPSDDGAKTSGPAQGGGGSSVDVQSELIELKKLALEYPAGSLERRAVEEEIGKLTGK
jgi:hypothetical protein